MNRYQENPCSTCCRKTEKDTVEMNNGLFETVKRSFCSAKRIFLEDRKGPCTSFTEESE